MPATEPVQAGPYPIPGDAPDGPNQMAAIVAWAAGRLVMRFASTTARDAAIAVPVAGMECVTGTGATMVKWLYFNAGWRDVTVRPWAAYTPVASSSGGAINLGTTGTAVGKAQQVGTTIRGWYVIMFGGTGISVPAGNITVSLPATAHGDLVTAGQTYVGSAMLFDASAATEFIRGIRCNGLLGQSALIVTQAAPVPWAASDTIRGSFELEVA